MNPAQHKSIALHKARMRHPEASDAHVRARHPEAGAARLPNGPLFIDVVARNMDDPDIPADRRRINYNNPKSRAWLARYAVWCMNNRHSLTTAPCEGD